jgi:hypothetical protein
MLPIHQMDSIFSHQKSQKIAKFFFLDEMKNPPNADTLSSIRLACRLVSEIENGRPFSSINRIEAVF